MLLLYVSGPQLPGDLGCLGTWKLSTHCPVIKPIAQTAHLRELGG